MYLDNFKKYILENKVLIVIICAMFLIIAGGLSGYVFSSYKLSSKVTNADSHEYGDYVATSETQTSEKTKSYVDISGAVENPGVYEIFGNERVMDLIRVAGGLSSNADIQILSQKINMSAKVQDSQKVYIPFIWDTELIKQGSVMLNSADLVTGTDVSAKDINNSNTITSDPNGYTSENSTNKIAINLATKEEIDTLPGVGEKYAQKIIETRPYKDLQEMEVRSGLPKILIGKISSLITF